MSSNFTSNFSVDDHPFPVEPKSASISYMDLDGESERNANGKLVRQIIRTNVRKVEIEFGPITTSEATEILGMLSKPNFKFTFPSPKKVGTETIEEAYCGDRQLGYLRTSVPDGYTINRGNTVASSGGNSAPASEGVTFSGTGNGGGNALYDGLKVSIIEY